MKTLILSLFLFASALCISQNVEIQGSAKVTNMSPDNSAGDLVVRQADGTLATRNVTSLPSSNPIDTTKNLASDFELAKHLCNCGTNLPPFMVQSLLASGYSERDLLDAGVPYSSIYEAIPVMDADGNDYSTITIGNQTWLRENLKTTKYNDGTDIPLITSGTTWSTTSLAEDPAYCWYNNDIANKDMNGALYNWYAISSTTNGGKEVCPVGWRVPTEADWADLSNALGGASAAGGAMKVAGFSNWTTNVGGTNSSGWTAYATGHRSSTGAFSGQGISTYYWDTQSTSTTNAERCYPSAYSTSLFYNGGSTSKERGYAVRCIRN